MTFRFWAVTLSALRLLGCAPEYDQHTILEPPPLPTDPAPVDSGCTLDLVTRPLGVNCDVFGVGIEFLPLNATETTSLSIYGNWVPGGADCWYGPNCPKMMAHYDAVGNWVGFRSPKFSANGVIRVGIGVTDQVGGIEDPEDPDWGESFLYEMANDPWIAQWVIAFEECGALKTNFCFERIDGKTYPALEKCEDIYDPPVCP